jgi:hypothetical protein
MGESYDEQLERVRMMAEGDDTWDLSSNDLAALKAVLSALAAVAAERDEAQSDLARAIDLEWLTKAKAALVERDARREAAREAQKKLRKEANLYASLTGQPGPLSDTWGWRDIAKTLHRVATDMLPDAPDGRPE